MDIFADSKLKRDEIVRKLIEIEMLNFESDELKLDDNKRHQILKNAINSNLIKAQLINRLIEENSEEPSDNDLRSFYEDNINQFQFSQKAFILNLAEFKVKSEADKFRYNALTFGWENADRKNVSRYNENMLKYANEILPKGLARLIESFNEGGISIVLETEPNNFIVVQLIKKIEKGEIPEFDFVKDLVRQRYFMKLNKDVLSNYITDLYNKYDVEIYR